MCPQVAAAVPADSEVEEVPLALPRQLYVAVAEGGFPKRLQRASWSRCHFRYLWCFGLLRWVSSDHALHHVHRGQRAPHGDG